MLLLKTNRSHEPAGYELNRVGRWRIHDEARLWEQAVNIMARFFDPEKETA